MSTMVKTERICNLIRKGILPILTKEMHNELLHYERETESLGDVQVRVDSDSKWVLKRCPLDIIPVSNVMSHMFNGFKRHHFLDYNAIVSKSQRSVKFWLVGIQEVRGLCARVC